MITSALTNHRGGRALVLVRMYGVGLVIGMVVLPLIGLLVSIMTGDPPVEPTTARRLLIALVFAPVFEELLFRGLPFLFLSHRPRVAILVGALAFGALHLAAHPAVAVIAFISGLLLGWVYWRSRIIMHGHWSAIVDPIAMHAGINAGAVVVGSLFGGVAG